MGLFSFLKNAGAKVLTKKNAKTVKTPEVIELENEILRKQKLILLNGVVESLSIPVKNLSLDYDDEVVTVYGTAQSQTDKEKIILALGNVSGVAAVDDRLSIVKKAKKEKASEMYTVQKGDSLSKIAKAHYGDARKYKRIFEANKPMLKDPNMIYPGQVLRIPALDA